MPVFYSNHLCVVESQGRAAAGRASGRMEERSDSPGRKSETRRVRGLGCHCQTTRSLRDCGSAACTRSPFPPPNSQKHLHARHLTSVTFELLRTVRTRSGERRQTETKEKKAQQTSSSGLSLALTSPSLVCISDELQIEIIKAHLSL